MSGFGHTGPYAQRPAYDVVAQAMGGIMSLTGQPGGPPTRVGTSIGDIAAGLFAAIGISAALAERERTGRGTLVDVAMLDAQVAILENAVARYLATGEVPGPLGSRHPSIAPFAAYAAADGHLVDRGRQRRAVPQALRRARPPRARRRRALRRQRGARRDTPMRWPPSSRPRSRAAPVADWLARLEAAGIPCGPIHDVAQVLADPQVRARNMVIRAGDAEMAGNPIKLATHPDPAERTPAPALDEHREAILRELGFEADDRG